MDKVRNYIYVEKVCSELRVLLGACTSSFRSQLGLRRRAKLSGLSVPVVARRGVKISRPFFNYCQDIGNPIPRDLARRQVVGIIDAVEL